MRLSYKKMFYVKQLINEERFIHTLTAKIDNNKHDFITIKWK